MQKQTIRDFILKTEKEIIQIPTDDPLIIKGRKFLRSIPSYKIDYFLERSSYETLSNLITFFNFLMKRKDISLLEQERLSAFIKAGKIEKGERERGINAKLIQEQAEEIKNQKEKIESQQKELLFQNEKLETQKLVIRGLNQTLEITKELLRKEIDSQRESIENTQQSVRNCKLIILFLSALSCIESTTQITISTSKRTAVQAKTVSKAILSAIVALWAGFSLHKKKD